VLRFKLKLTETGAGMANQYPEQDDTLTKVARTVGSALGAVASKVNGLVGDDAGESPSQQAESLNARSTSPAKNSPGKKSGSAGKKSQPPASNQSSRAQEQKKTKRDKHRRKLHRKTRG
jgi:hypothetical protein